VKLSHVKSSFCITKFHHRNDVSMCKNKNYKDFQRYFVNFFKKFKGNFKVTTKYIKNCDDVESVVKIYDNSSVIFNSKCEIISNVCNEVTKPFKQNMVLQLILWKKKYFYKLIKDVNCFQGYVSAYKGSLMIFNGTNNLCPMKLKTPITLTVEHLFGKIPCNTEPVS
jgi:hypothetical protein